MKKLALLFVATLGLSAFQVIASEAPAPPEIPTAPAEQEPLAPVHRTRQPFTEPLADDETRRRRQATAAHETLVRQRNELIQERLGNGEKLQDILDSLEPIPDLEEYLSPAAAPEGETGEDATKDQA